MGGEAEEGRGQPPDNSGALELEVGSPGGGTVVKIDSGTATATGAKLEVGNVPMLKPASRRRDDVARLQDALRSDKSCRALRPYADILARLAAGLATHQGRPSTRAERVLAIYDREIQSGRIDSPELRHVVVEEAGCAVRTLERALKKRALRQS
jgi:hypothetical protein